MFRRVFTGGIVAAAAGAAMFAMTTMTTAPASAFTLSAPSLEQRLVESDIEKVYWHRGWGGGWHGGWHRGGGWHGGWGWGGGWGWRRHCWVNRWGYIRC